MILSLFLFGTYVAQGSKRLTCCVHFLWATEGVVSKGDQEEPHLLGSQRILAWGRSGPLPRLDVSSTWGRWRCRTRHVKSCVDGRNPLRTAYETLEGRVPCKQINGFNHGFSLMRHGFCNYPQEVNQRTLKWLWARRTQSAFGPELNVVKPPGLSFGVSAALLELPGTGVAGVPWVFC